MLQREVDALGQQQNIEGTHQAQAVLTAQARRHEGKADVGAGAMAPKAP
jgi:hypothetical protein